MIADSSRLPHASKVKSPFLDQVRRAVRVRNYSMNIGVIFSERRTRTPRWRKARALLQRVSFAAVWAIAFFFGRRPA